VSVRCSVGFCLGILPVNLLHFNPSNPSITLPYPFPPTLYCQINHIWVGIRHSEIYFLVLIWDRVLLCSLGWPWTFCIARSWCRTHNLPASTSQVLRLQMCATKAGFTFFSVLLCTSVFNFWDAIYLLFLLFLVFLASYIRNHCLIQGKKDLFLCFLLRVL
jgi:hypothetical protein